MRGQATTPTNARPPSEWRRPRDSRSLASGHPPCPMTGGFASFAPTTPLLSVRMPGLPDTATGTVGLDGDGRSLNFWRRRLLDHASSATDLLRRHREALL